MNKNHLWKENLKLEDDIIAIPRPRDKLFYNFAKLIEYCKENVLKL